MAEWNRRVEASLRKERVEIEARYGIRVGMTSISSARCNRPWEFGEGHSCHEDRLRKLKKSGEKGPQNEDTPISLGGSAGISSPGAV